MKKGFTLIEIIVCIALIALISTTSIILLKKNNDYSEITKKIINAANVYIATEKDDKGNTYEYGITHGGKGVQINVNELLNKGYISKSTVKTLEEKFENKDKIYLIQITNAIKNKNDNECKSSGFEYNVNWEKTEETMYLCPYDNQNSESNGTIKNLILNKYSYIDNKPDFKKISPKNQDVNNGGKYRYLSKQVSYSNFTNDINNTVDTRHSYTENKCEKISGNHEVGDDWWSFDYGNYFAKNFEFDENTGIFKLKDYRKAYMDDYFNEGYVYSCPDQSLECKEMYKVEEYLSYPTTSDRRVQGCNQRLTSGLKYYSLPKLDETDSGLYKTHDDDGDTYYFRGNILNNYIKFEGSNLLFQIMRFNGDESIRLLSLNNTGESFKSNIMWTYETVTHNYEFSVGTKEYSISSKDGWNIYVFNDPETELNFDTETGRVSRISGKGEKFEDDEVDYCQKINDNRIEYIFANKNKVYYVDNCSYTGSGYGRVYRFKVYDIVSTKKDDTITTNNNELHNVLNKWYNENLKLYDEYIISGKFCNDLSANYLEDTHNGDWSGKMFRFNSTIRLYYDQDYINPTFECYKYQVGKGGLINSKVGTLTADDLIFGGMISKYGYSNGNNYLTRDKNYFTMSACSYIKSNYLVLSCSEIKNSSDFGNYYSFESSYKNANISLYTYPVINIRGDVELVNDKAAGTKDDPFVIKTKYD